MKKRYEYIRSFDAEITALVQSNGWGALKIWQHLQAKHSRFDVSIATIQRRVRKVKQSMTQ